MANSLKCTIMRGGTSKAVFVREDDLPPRGDERDHVILRAFGSPDVRQIDGLGGADPLTSKLAIIGPSPGPQAHLTYTFGQVEIDEPHIDYLSLCGNISSAVGLYAVQEGLVVPTEPVTRVLAYNTNLACVLIIEVQVRDGVALEAGEYSIPGVPGTGARIQLDLAATAGKATGNLLPTGHAIDTLEVNGIGSIEVSLIDVGNAHVFIRASDVELKGTETPAEIDGDRGLLDRLEYIRGAAALRMKMATSIEAARKETPATPILAMIAPPQPYTSYLDGSLIEDVDVLGRLQFMQKTHKTYAATSTVCTGVAARIENSIVAEALSDRARQQIELNIGHPGGVIETESDVALDKKTGELVVRRATLGRTARRILDGVVFVD